MTPLSWLGAGARIPLAAALLAVLAGCPSDKGDDSGEPDPNRPTLEDADGDGYGDDVDCDPAGASVNPGADELCNGIDDDCDGLTDEPGAVDGAVWYPDADGDGYGDDLGATAACEQPEGTVAVGGDCDDGNASSSPALTESCDGIDNDCDGDTDEEGATGGLGAHPDADGDGYGDDGITVTVCEFGAGYVANGDDCDDTNAEVMPTAREVCDGLDNDCDGDTDDDARDASTWYEDGDGDGYGLDDSTVEACDQPDGYARKDGDCADDDARTNPGEDERCDDEDNDCDGLVDDDPVDAETWYLDTDGDGYGPTETALTQCDEPGEGYVTLGGDCDEEDTEVNPGAEETWYDGWDTDCDGASDYDQDADGYVLADLADEDAPTYDPGTGEIIDDGSETEGGDCDDENNRINPGREERCNDTDDDCDGEIDDDAVDAKTWYTDADGDDYGDESTALTTCDSVTGDYIRTGGDCDDSDPDVNPGATESCDDADGVDNDCDGTADEVCYDADLNFQYGYGTEPTDRECDVIFSGSWEIAEDTCPDCEYGFTTSYEVDRDLSEGAASCGYGRGATITWTLGLDLDYAGSDEAMLWYPYTYWYYEYDDDDYDYGDVGYDTADSPPAAYVWWYPRFDATFDESTGALTFWDGTYEYAYDYGRYSYYFTHWWYGSTDLAGIGG